MWNVQQSTILTNYSHFVHKENPDACQGLHFFGDIRSVLYVDGRQAACPVLHEIESPAISASRQETACPPARG